MRFSRILVGISMLAMLAFASNGAQAQEKSLRFGFGSTTVYDSPDIPDVEGKITVFNNKSEALDVKVRMVVLELAAGHQSYFCWDNCYSPGQTESGIVTLGPNEGIDIFSAHILPNGVAGTSRVLYEFYLAGSPDDKITLEFTFAIGTTDVEVPGLNAANVSLSSYPSPATDFVRINYTIPYQFSNAKLSILNLFGHTLHTSELKTQQDTKTLSMASFNPGVYFYTLIVDGKRVVTKKLVVKR